MTYRKVCTADNISFAVEHQQEEEGSLPVTYWPIETGEGSLVVTYWPVEMGAGAWWLPTGLWRWGGEPGGYLPTCKEGGGEASVTGM